MDWKVHWSNQLHAKMVSSKKSTRKQLTTTWISPNLAQYVYKLPITHICSLIQPAYSQNCHTNSLSHLSQLYTPPGDCTVWVTHGVVLPAETSLVLAEQRGVTTGDSFRLGNLHPTGKSCSSWCSVPALRGCALLLPSSREPSSFSWALMPMTPGDPHSSPQHSGIQPADRKIPGSLKTIYLFHWQ